MYYGDLSLQNAKYTSFVLVFCGFMSIVAILAQDEIFDVPILDIFQTLICWPSMIEVVVISFTLWSLRHIERLLGQNSTQLFLLVNFVTYAPTFCAIIYTFGIKSHYSLLFFVPYSLFIFMLWRVPALSLDKMDKLLISCVFSVEII